MFPLAGFFFRGGGGGGGSRNSRGVNSNAQQPVTAAVDFCRKESAIEKRSTNRPSAPAPAITLHYDAVKKVTIAVLAPCQNRVDSEAVNAYFQSRVADGTAYIVSPLYYELEGFIRENLSWIRKALPDLTHQTESSVSVAMGSLEESDDVQRRKMLDEKEASNRNTHHRLRVASAGAVGTSSPDLRGDGGGLVVDADWFEEVLEIARLHRLNDDLDVLSVYFMRQTSKSFGRVAARIAFHRLQSQTSLALTPLVDGVYISGYSKFVRRDGLPLHHIHTTRYLDSGRAVEYQRCLDIDLNGASGSSAVRSSTNECLVGLAGKFAPSEASDPYFDWKCEEVSLANLHRWWGVRSKTFFFASKFSRINVERSDLNPSFLASFRMLTNRMFRCLNTLARCSS